MHTLNLSRLSAGKIPAALCALLALSGLPAHAGQTPYDPNGDASQLGPGAVTTPTYPGSASVPQIPSPFVTGAGGQTITFTATGEPTNGIFQTFRNQAVPGTSMPALDFALNTQLLNTSDPRAGVGPTPNGPLAIDFSSGVGAFGLKVESGVPDFEQFTFSTFNGANLVGTYLSPVFDSTAGSGKSVFLGAQATGMDVFTRVVISSTSKNADGTPTGADNNFYFGPLAVPQAAPVPEASSAMGLGLSLALFGGLSLVGRRRRAARAA